MFAGRREDRKKKIYPRHRAETAQAGVGDFFSALSLEDRGYSRLLALCSLVPSHQHLSRLHISPGNEGKTVST